MFTEGLSAAAQQLNCAVRRTAVAAIVGSATMLAASASHAVVVYSGAVNLAIPLTTNGLYLNVVTGANNLPASGAGSTVAGWDINIWSATGLNLFTNTTSSTIFGSTGTYVISATNTASNLAVGSSIGSASTYGSSTATTPWTLNSSDNIFGFRFVGEDSLVHYGWARMAIGSSLTTRSLVDYGYESVAGTSILAGAVGAVPEPSTYAMLGLGVAGLLLARRRKQG